MAVKVSGTEVVTNSKEIVNVPKITISEKEHSFVFDSPTEIFIYDTKEDSDGGAWRKKCLGASWYKEQLNTAYRGATKEFPEVALIAASATQLGIFDLTSAGSPMWLLDDNHRSWVYGLSTFSFESCKISASNGVIAIANPADEGGQGLYIIDLVEDTLNVFCDDSQTGPVTGGFVGNGKFPLITGMNSAGTGNFVDLKNYETTCVSLGVLPGAEINPVTGLPGVSAVIGTTRSIEIIKDVRTADKTSMQYDSITIRSHLPERTVFDEVVGVLLKPDGELILSFGFRGTCIIPFSNYPRPKGDSPDTYLGPKIGEILGARFFSGSVGKKPIGVFSSPKVMELSGVQSTGNLELLHKDIFSEDSFLVNRLATENAIGGCPPGVVLSAYNSTKSLVGQYPSNLPSTAFDSPEWTLGEGFSVVDGSLVFSGGLFEQSRCYLQLNSHTTTSASYQLAAEYSAEDAEFAGDTTPAIHIGVTSLTNGNRFGTINLLGDNLAQYTFRTDDRFDARYIMVIAPPNAAAFSVDVLTIKPVTGNAAITGNVVDKPVAQGAKLQCGTGFNDAYFDIASNYYGKEDNSRFCVNFWLKWEEAATVLDGLVYVAVNETKTLSVGYQNLPENMRISADLVNEWSLVTITKKGNNLLLHVDARFIGSVQVPPDQFGFIGSGRNGNFSIALLRVTTGTYTENELSYVYQNEKNYFQKYAYLTVNSYNSNYAGLSYDSTTQKTQLSSRIRTQAVHGYALDAEVRVSNSNSLIRVKNNTIVGSSN